MKPSPGCSQMLPGLILAKSLAKPHWFESQRVSSAWFCLPYPGPRRPEGIINLVLYPIPLPAKTSGYNQPGFASYTLARVDQRVYRLGFVSHTLVRVDQRVYRLGFVSHTLARKFFRVQIAWIRSQYPRPHKYIKILTGRYLRCPSVFLSVNIYFINGLLQSVRLHILELLQHFFRRSLGSEADCNDSDKSQPETNYQGI